jgi:NADH-quinone oxidoreductase subunit J
MVYIGAIVVLFLFIVMMLDIKVSNTLQNVQDFFSYKNIIVALILIEFMIFNSENIQLVEYISQMKDVLAEKKVFTFYTELYDYFQVLKTTTHLEAIGQVLYKHHLFAFLLCSVLLFIAMIGAIVMTVEDNTKRTIKQQIAGMQSIKVFRVNRRLLQH